MDKAQAIMKIESFSHKEGTLLLSVSEWSVRAMLKGLVDLCTEKHGGYVKLEMKPPYRQRTLPENDKYWAMCTEYARFLGTTKNLVSIGVKWRACEEGLWELEDVPCTNGKVKQPKSTVESDVKQMSILIDVLYRVASEDGYIFKE